MEVSEQDSANVEKNLDNPKGKEDFFYVMKTLKNCLTASQCFSVPIKLTWFPA